MSAYIGGGLALLAAVCIAALFGPVLRALPPPAEQPSGYGVLATRGFTGATAAVALAAGMVPAWRDPHPWLWLPLVLVLIPACAVDAATTFLPLRLTQAGWLVTALAVGVAAFAAHDGRLVARAAFGALALGLAFYLGWRLHAVGFGDVRLMISVGAVTAAVSLNLLLTGLLTGAVIGALWGVVRLVTGRGRGPFAYGPALLAGPFVALALGTT